MLDIRITIEPDQFDKVYSMLDEIWKGLENPQNCHIICVHEGEPYDKDVKSHLHAYLSFMNKSESWLRKSLQALDKSRKGNNLYSMKKSHDNSPNYVLKKVFDEEQKSGLKNPRIVYIKGNIPWDEYRNRYSSYLKQISKKEKQNTKDSKFQLIIEHCYNKYSERIDQVNNIETLSDSIINDILVFCQDEGYPMPSKSQMEIYVLTVISKTKWNNGLVKYYSSITRNFYSPY